MSVLRISDLYARSERRPGSGCWHWLGATSTDGSPRIHTYDHDRCDKRSMSGAKAVWNISRSCGTAGKLAFRLCLMRDCVKPDHIALALSKAEIGAHIAARGGRKGTHLQARRLNAGKAWAARKVAVTPPETVLAIRGMQGSNVAIGRALGMRHQTVSRIRRGESHRHLLSEQEA